MVAGVSAGVIIIATITIVIIAVACCIEMYEEINTVEMGKEFS